MLCYIAIALQWSARGFIESREEERDGMQDKKQGRTCEHKHTTSKVVGQVRQMTVDFRSRAPKVRRSIGEVSQGSLEVVSDCCFLSPFRPADADQSINQGSSCMRMRCMLTVSLEVFKPACKDKKELFIILLGVHFGFSLTRHVASSINKGKWIICIECINTDDLQCCALTRDLYRPIKKNKSLDEQL